MATDIACETDSAGADRCPDDELLLGYVEGQHSAATLAKLDEHIERCGRCEDALRLFALVTGSACSSEGALPEVPARYRVLEALGRGGQGTVWRAHDTRLGRDVALKLVHCPEPRHRLRLRTEARALAALEHPNVLEIFDVELSSSPGFLTMPVYRESLADGIRGGTRWGAAVELMRQAACGLSAVHRAGLVHRDIKPANLLRDEAGTVVLGDFGIVSMGGSKTLGPPSDPERSAEATLTSVCGTPAYMAPAGTAPHSRFGPVCILRIARPTDHRETASWGHAVGWGGGRSEVARASGAARTQPRSSGSVPVDRRGA